MFINFQNNSLEASAKILSLSVSTNNTVLNDSEKFDSILERLINKFENEGFLIQSTRDSMKPLMSQAEKISLLFDVTTLEKLDADRVIEINAELVLDGGDVRTLSLPVMIIFAEQYRNIEPDKTTLYNKVVDIKSLEGIETVNDPHVLAENSEVIDKFLQISNDFSQLLQTGSVMTVSILSPKAENNDNGMIYKLNIDIEEPVQRESKEFFNPDITGTKPAITENTDVSKNNELKVNDLSEFSGLTFLRYDGFSDETLVKTQNGTQSGENYTGNRVFVQKFIIEAVESDSDVPRFVLQTSSDKPRLVIKPLENTSSENSLIKLLNKYSSTGEPIEIAIVVKTDTLVTSGSVPDNNTHVLNSNIPELLDSTAAEKIVAGDFIYDNIIKPKSSVDIFYNQISNQDIIKQLSIIKNIDSGVEQNITESFAEDQVQMVISTVMGDGKPETTGKKYVETQGNNSQIKEIQRDYSLLQSDSMVGKSDLLKDHDGTFMVKNITGTDDSSVEINNNLPDVQGEIIESTGLQSDSMVGKSDLLKDHDGTFMVKNITGTDDSSVEINNNLPDVQGKIIESTGYGKAGTTQHFVDNGVKEAEVIQNTGKTGDGFKIESGYRVISETDDSGKSTDRYKLMGDDTHSYEKAVNSEINENIEVKPESMTSYRADDSKDSSVKVFNPAASKDNTSETGQEKNSDMAKSSHAAGISKTESIDSTNRGISGMDNSPANDFQENNGEKNSGIYKSRIDETTHYRDSNILQYSVKQKNINSSVDNQENVHAEFESSPGSNLSFKTSEMNTQNAFQQNPEFLSDRESSQKHLFSLANLTGDDIPETEMDADGKLFGIYTNSESSGNPVSGTGVENHVFARMYGNIDEKQILNSIVRQARFMSQKGQSSAVIKLEPPSLGKLRLDIVTENSRVTGRIIVESPKIKEIIQHSISELRENLAQNGLKVDSFDVQVGHNGGTDIWARMEKFKIFKDNALNLQAFENNSNVSVEEQTIMSKALRNRSLYSEVIDVWI